MVESVPIPPDADLAIRQLALNYSLSIAAPWLRDTTGLVVAAGLNLSASDSRRALEQAAPRKEARPSPAASSAAASFWVDPVKGSDSNPGDESKPWRTLERCVKYLASTPPASRGSGVTFFLRNGTFTPSSPIQLTNEMGYAPPSTATVTFQADAGATPVVSGGIEVGPLQWKATSGSPNPDGSRSFRASIPSSFGPALRSIGGPPSLFVNDLRFWPARFPNGDPTKFCNPFRQPAGGCTVFAKASSTINPPPSPDGPTALPVNTKVTVKGVVVAQGTTFPVDGPSRSVEVISTTPEWDQPRPTCNGFHAESGGALDRYNQTLAVPFWGTSRPLAVQSDDLKGKASWVADTPSIYVNMMHPDGWGSWAFQASKFDASTGLMNFSRGGFQEARGGSARAGQMFYASNIESELDASREFFLDAGSMTLTVAMPAGASPPATVVVPVLEELFRVVGADGTAQAGLARGFEIRGLVLRHTLPTYMSDYEMPSGGDWAIHRGGAVFVSNASNVVIASNFFDQVEGGGVFLSQRVQDSTVTGNRFHEIGDTPVAMQGSCLLMDCTAGMFVTRVNVTHNLMDTWGVWVVQTAGVYVSISRDNYIAFNTMFDGPRAAVNVNDAIGGGNVFFGNLAFDIVAQSSDHGTLNSWDRRPAFWAVTDPQDREGDGAAGAELTHVPATQVSRRNFFFRSSYTILTNSIYCSDHDDGSSQWFDDTNVYMRGAVKYRDGVDKATSGNLIIFPDYGQPYACAFQVAGYEYDSYVNNTLVTTTGQAYGGCAGFDASQASTKPKVDGNQFFMWDGGATWNNGGCGTRGALSLSDWQKLGYDIHSTSEPWGSRTAADLVAMAVARLPTLTE